MSRKIALPLLVAAALVSIILASRTPQPIIEELPPEEADAPTALLTQTEEVGDQTVTLRVYEPDEAGYARYALFGADGAEIDIPFGVNRGTWIWNGNAAEKVSLTARDDVLGFPGFELETIQGIVMTVCDFYALTEQGFVYAGEAFGLGFDDTEWGDGVWPLDLTGDGRSELVTRSTFGTGVPYVFVYRWNAAEGISQHSGIVWEKADAQLAATHPQGKEEFCGMVIKGVAYDEKKTAGERLVLACSELPNAEEKVIGSYRGFELSLRFDTLRSEYQALLKGQRKHTVPLGTDPLGNIIRLDNSLNSFPERITAAENELATLHQQQAAAQIEVEKPFPQEEELAEKSARLAELNAQLDVDEKSHEPEQDEEEQEDPPRRPSVLAALEEKSDKPEPVKPFRSYYDKDGDAR